jgi:hypothetical protein
MAMVRSTAVRNLVSSLGTTEVGNDLASSSRRARIAAF